MALNQLLFQLEVTVWKWQLLALIQRKHDSAETGLFFVFVRVLYMLDSLWCYIFFPLPDILQVMLAAVFKSLYMESEWVNTLHKCPKTSTDTVLAFASLSEFQRASVPKRWLWNSSARRSVPDTVPFLVVLFLPHLRCSWILSASQKRDEQGRHMKIPHIKYRWQKINRHRLQIYDLPRCRIYQISCWNI